MRIWHPTTPSQALVASVALILAVCAAMAGGTLYGGPLTGLAIAIPIAFLIPAILR